MKLLILLVIIFSCKSELIVFKESEHTDLSHIYNYFNEIDKIITLNNSFDKNTFRSYDDIYNITGYILPGGKSNFSDYKSKYWEYTNLVMETNKPKICICLGMEHVVKYFTNVTFSRCYIYRTMLDNEYHNHKWCIRKSLLHKNLYKFNDKNIYIKYKRYNNMTFLNEIKSYKHNMYGFAYHPEKKILSLKSKHLSSKDKNTKIKIKNFIKGM